MNKASILVGILCVVIVGGALLWRQYEKSPAPQGNPTITETPTNTPSVTKEATPTATTPMKTTQYNAPPTMTIDQNKTYVATITTDKGVMTIPLFAKETPVTVNNFVFLARAGFYTNTIFHRVMKGFMIQGGDPKGDGTGGPGYKFADERITRDYTRGTIAMANSGPNTNGSQFFIMHQDYPLPKHYVIFGAIDQTDSASLATLDAIASTPVVDNGMGEQSKPVTPPVIQSVYIKEE